MPLTCNIDSKGKLLRLILGLINIVVGVILVFTWALRSGGGIAWTVTIALILAGLFQVFEGWAGWCVVRAMGIKTRI
jgi:uncharacterized membrane protein HdeD (DUF308 family)